MPLSAGKSELTSSLATIFGDVGGPKDARLFAQRKAQAVKAFVLTAKPMTLIITMPGPVAGAMTGGPVEGKGLGGHDKPSPGMGLNSAHSILTQNLIEIYTHGNVATDYHVFASKIAGAVFSYFSEAMVMTKDKSKSPVPAPPTSGPAAGAIFGIGGVEKDIPGIGYDAAYPALEESFYQIFTTIQTAGTVPQYAARISDAIHAFCLEAIITTIGTFVAPAAVDPISQSGAYFPGVGLSITSTIS